MKPSQIKICEVERKDLAAIVRLFAIPDEGNTKNDDPSFPLNRNYYDAFELMKTQKNNDLFVAKIDNRIVGVFQLTIIQYIAYQGGQVAQIENVVVEPTERSRGIGAQMMAWAVREAKIRGCFRVQLTSRKGRDRAHSFYTNLGFEKSHDGFRLKL